MISRIEKRIEDLLRKLESLGARLIATGWVAPLAVASAASLMLYKFASTYLPFVSDDSFISLRYADRLIHGQGLTWSDGERVEGFTNFLWVIGCALLGLLRIDLIDASRVLGILSAIATIAALVWAYRCHRQTFCAWEAGAIGAFVIASSGTIAVWAIGGLEQCLLAALLGWSIALLWEGIDEPSLSPRKLWLSLGVVMGLCWWTRPDAALLVGLLLLSAAAIHRFRWTVLKKLALSAGTLFAMGLALLLFRLAYYHAWVPNSATAKLAWTPERLKSGLEYLEGGLRNHAPLAPLVVAALLSLGFSPSSRRRVAVLLPTAIAWLAYVVAIGGDIFPARRHFAPVVVLLAFLASEGIHWLSSHQKVKSLRIAVGVVASICVYVFFLQQLKDPENRRADGERWEWDGKPIGEFIYRHMGARKPLLAVDCAGNLPYFAKVPAIDMLGLNDKYLASHPPPDFGKGLIGHDLGDGTYVLGRKPDLVIFHLPDGGPRPEFRSGWEMVRDPSFHRDYLLIPFEAPGSPRFTSRVWVRKDSPKIGIERSNNEIVIPGYLLASSSFATDDAEGRLGAIISSQFKGNLQVEVPQGDWQLSAESSAMPLRTSVSFGNYMGRGNPSLDFSVSAPTTVLLDLAVDIGMAHVRKILIRRK